VLPVIGSEGLERAKVVVGSKYVQSQAFEQEPTLLLLLHLPRILICLRSRSFGFALAIVIIGRWQGRQLRPPASKYLLVDLTMRSCSMLSSEALSSRFFREELSLTPQSPTWIITGRFGLFFEPIHARLPALEGGRKGGKV
jgi:hypothetical protein